jgi:hypothetical protein
MNQNFIEDGWKIREGKIPVLFVAQHAFPQKREGVLKPEDLMTGSIAEMLAQKLDAFSIITTQVQDDPNWYENSLFRQKVFELVKANNIKLVIDLHGRKNDSENERELFLNKTLKEKYKIDFGDEWRLMEFKNNEQLTLSEDLDKEDIPSCELELRLDVRQNILAGNDVSIEELLNKLI